MVGSSQCTLSPGPRKSENFGSGRAMSDGDEWHECQEWIVTEGCRSEREGLKGAIRTCSDVWFGDGGRAEDTKIFIGNKGLTELKMSISVGQLNLLNIDYWIWTCWAGRKE